MGSITLDNVSKSYAPGQPAVAGISLDIPTGCYCVLVGPSGCGKSTTLRLVAGLEECTGGRVLIAGQDVTRVPPKDRDIAMVFQNYALYPHMSVRQNLSFALKMRKTPRPDIARRVGAVAEMLGLGELMDRKPRALSGGQRQRVALGRAIVREPKAFLFDEPLSNLDARLRVSTRVELKSLHQRLRTTTVHVTHDQEEAMSLGEMVVVMEAGQVQQAGPPLEVYQRPANRFVAGFVGTPPMNFIDGHASDGVFEGPGGLRVPIAHRSAGAPGTGAAVLGFRPQALGDAGGVPLTLGVRSVEHLGESSDVAGEIAPGVGIVARLSARPALAPGASLAIRLDATRVHLFAPGPRGARLGGGAP
ncbi:MAG: sn-glycerol-3-phosphate ABC transporter ATP-binding protein UgpC [Phycisphaerales bacterium]|nr:sn-glycerol-3-phosphate ABC transporter ATP-binding protein UgpC [Phycisphaerales bacterium]